MLTALASILWLSLFITFGTHAYWVHFLLFAAVAPRLFFLLRIRRQ